MAHAASGSETYPATAHHDAARAVCLATPRDAIGKGGEQGLPKGLVWIGGVVGAWNEASQLCSDPFDLLQASGMASRITGEHTVDASCEIAVRPSREALTGRKRVSL